MELNQENQENQEIRVIRDAPSVQDYVKLREQAGLSPRSAEGAEVGLRNSLFAVSLYDPEGLVGMGRVIGDGGCFMQVVDIAVHPDAQGQGLGSRIVGEIVGYLETSAPPLAYVSLIADPPADRLYRKFGFEYTAPQSHGMFMRIGNRA